MIAVALGERFCAPRCVNQYDRGVSYDFERQGSVSDLPALVIEGRHAQRASPVSIRGGAAT